MKSNHSPRATCAPALRARAIPRSGSKTTWAPAPRAVSEVLSVEALSQTMISEVSPCASFAWSASLIRRQDQDERRQCYADPESTAEVRHHGSVVVVTVVPAAFGVRARVVLHPRALTGCTAVMVWRA